MNRTNLLGRLLKNKWQQSELEAFLPLYFKKANFRESNVVDYGAVKLEYSATNRKKLKAIWLGDAVEPEVITRLESEIDEALCTDHGQVIGSAYIFLCAPVQGIFRYRDSFQIIPIPPRAPQAMFPQLGENPALLEFAYESSPNSRVDAHRRNKRKLEILGFLSVLIAGHLNWHSVGGEQQWVALPSNEFSSGGDSTPDYGCQSIGYYTREAWPKKDEKGFSTSNEWREIPVEDRRAYYNRDAVLDGRPLTFPDVLDLSVSTYEALSSKAQEEFQRAAYWLKKSSDMSRISQSLSFCALVYALEGLIDKPKKIDDCVECGKDQFDRSFSEGLWALLKEYGSGVSQKEINEVYRIRSAVSHGRWLMPDRDEVNVLSFTAENNVSRNMAFKLQKICRIVLVNWLHSENRYAA